VCHIASLVAGWTKTKLGIRYDLQRGRSEQENKMKNLIERLGASIDGEIIEEAISESLIDRMVQAMVDAPKFQKLLKSSEKYIEDSGSLASDLNGAVKNALVMTLAKHGAKMGGSLAGQAKRETKKAVTAS